MNKLRFPLPREVFLIVLLGFIAVGASACPGRTGIDVYVENQTQSNFHINSRNGERVEQGSESKFTLYLYEDDPVKSFWICRDAGCSARVTVVGINFPERTEEHEEIANVINLDWVVIEEPDVWNIFTAHSKNGNVSVSVDN